METQASRIQNVFPFWLWKASFEITKIYHYTSMVQCPLLRIENYAKHIGLLAEFISKIEKQLVGGRIFIDNKTVYEIKFFHQECLIILHCGFYDNNFTIGLGVATESVCKPTEVSLFAENTKESSE